MLLQAVGPIDMRKHRVKEVNEPKFLKEIHQIRRRLSRIPRDEYVRQLERVREYED